MLHPEVNEQPTNEMLVSNEMNAAAIIASIMAAAGLIETPEAKAASEKDLNHIQRMFKNAGAGIDDAAIKIAELMESNKGEIALRACETALKVQGVFNEKDKGRVNPTVTINVHNSFGSDSKTLVNLIMPAAQ